MAKVTVGKSKCEPVRRLRGAPLSHRGSRERCQVVASPLPAVSPALRSAQSARGYRIENTTDTCTVSSSEPLSITMLLAAVSSAAAALGRLATGP